ncbi:MAG: hypothetical protein Ct9H90mP16_21050 [Candidatus Poseidoniales archaeon]|nr:MAG: hypothetical protein Ct9H90mP16_21050 [Candidatus Poseidoniales archaeon]
MTDRYVILSTGILPREAHATPCQSGPRSPRGVHGTPDVGFDFAIGAGTRAERDLISSRHLLTCPMLARQIKPIMLFYLRKTPRLLE